MHQVVLQYKEVAIILTKLCVRLEMKANEIERSPKHVLNLPHIISPSIPPCCLTPLPPSEVSQQYIMNIMFAEDNSSIQDRRGEMGEEMGRMYDTRIRI